MRISPIFSKDDFVPEQMEFAGLKQRNGGPDAPLADLVETVRLVIANLETRHHRGRSLRLDSAPHTRPVRAEASEIHLAATHLFENRLEDVPEGGALMIEAFTTILDESHPKVFLGGSIPGEYTMLAVSDSGPGKDREALSRMFQAPLQGEEPDGFTARGLYLVRDIVQRWGGYIWSYSESGHGTQVEVFLPVARHPRIGS